MRLFRLQNTFVQNIEIMTDRRLLGIALLATFLILSGTGTLMYFSPFDKHIASLHTLFAWLFVLGIAFHIINNKVSLSNYISGKKLTYLKKAQSPLLFLAAILLGLAVYTDLPYFNGIYNWGNAFRNAQLGKTETSFDYQIIELDQAIGNHKLSIEFKKGKSFQYPLFAVWLEDSVGNYLETLYISRVISSSKFDYGKKVDETWEAAIVRRPEALPYWSHQRGIQASDGLYIPLDNAPDLDGVSGATPTGNFIIESKASIFPNQSYRILLEVNQSYDWNDYYTEGKFPNDSIYSGSGQVGQPSLIYSAAFQSNNVNPNPHKIMDLIGHGHYSGKNGVLYRDLSTISTAKKIANRIIVTLENQAN